MIKSILLFQNDKCFYCPILLYQGLILWLFYWFYLIIIRILFHSTVPLHTMNVAGLRIVSEWLCSLSRHSCDLNLNLRLIRRYSLTRMSADTSNKSQPRFDEMTNNHKDFWQSICRVMVQSMKGWFIQISLNTENNIYCSKRAPYIPLYLLLVLWCVYWSDLCLKKYCSRQIFLSTQIKRLTV